jgi:acetolactate synthase-1/3 small subunit
MEKHQYTIVIFTENHIGLLNRVSIVFTRRHLNIDSITASESEIKGVYRYTIVLVTTEKQVKKVVSQIEKLVEVLRASYYLEDEVIHQEIALYKVESAGLANSNEVEKLVRYNNARILAIEPDYIVIEKTGYKAETQELFEKLEPFGVLQFVRSGRVALTKQRKELTSYLKEIDKASDKSDKIREWKLSNGNGASTAMWL